MAGREAGDWRPETGGGTAGGRLPITDTDAGGTAKGKRKTDFPRGPDSLFRERVAAIGVHAERFVIDHERRSPIGRNHDLFHPLDMAVDEQYSSSLS